jgi:glycine C-acetyltransferase
VLFQFYTFQVVLNRVVPDLFRIIYILLKFLLYRLIISTFANSYRTIFKSEIIINQDNMYSKFQDHLTKELAGIKEAGLFKNERVIVSPQGAEITISSGAEVLNFCANNYLGLSNNPQLIAAAKDALDTHGYGLSSVRFICGTQDLHKTLEAKIAEFFGTEDTILYAACFDANGGVFEPLLGENDAIISDSLNHASIIDGVRLCKAQRYRYENSNMADLEEQLKLAQAQNFRLIVTDAVFSMDGNAAKLDEIYALAQKYDAMIMVDECHSAGVVGKTGRGITELHNLKGKIEIITGTLGKAFGGAIGGFTTGKKEIIGLLRQRSRPYLFSNSIPPVVAAAGIRMFEMMSETNELQDKLHANTEYFVSKMLAAGFDIKPTQSAICAVMLYDAKLSQEMAAKLLNEGIYVIGFYYPVVPKDKARIRVQISAAHEREHLDKCIAAFTKVGKELGVIKSGDSGCGCGCSCGN